MFAMDVLMCLPCTINQMAWNQKKCGGKYREYLRLESMEAHRCYLSRVWIFWEKYTIRNGLRWCEPILQSIIKPLNLAGGVFELQSITVVGHQTFFYSLMLILLIPGKESVTFKNIHVYLAPLIEELQELWMVFILLTFYWQWKSKFCP